MPRQDSSNLVRLGKSRSFAQEELWEFSKNA